MARSFLKCSDFSVTEAALVLEEAKRLKAERKQGNEPVLAGQTWALIFEKSSTRTRVSFEVGVHELGGHPMYLDQSKTQMGRGETVSDTAKVMSRFVHGIIIRTYEQSLIEELAGEGNIPVVNGLTNELHPCQIYTDIFTLAEKWVQPGQTLAESVKGRKIAFVGDCGSNMAHSWILGGALFGMQISLGGPAAYCPNSVYIDRLLSEAGLPKNYTFTTDAKAAVGDADCVYTDVWVSMGDEAEAADRVKSFRPYQVNGALFGAAKSDAYFMHCLPAHEGEEVSRDVLDSPRSIIFDEAENRLHVQKAILAQLVKND